MPTEWREKENRFPLHFAFGLLATEHDLAGQHIRCVWTALPLLARLEATTIKRKQQRHLSVCFSRGHCSVAFRGRHAEAARAACAGSPRGVRRDAKPENNRENQSQTTVLTFQMSRHPHVCPQSATQSHTMDLRCIYLNCSVEGKKTYRVLPERISPEKCRCRVFAKGLRLSICMLHDSP